MDNVNNVTDQQLADAIAAGQAAAAEMARRGLPLPGPPCICTQSRVRAAWVARRTLPSYHMGLVQGILHPKPIRFHSRLSLNALTNCNALMHAFWGETFAVWARARPRIAGFASGLIHRTLSGFRPCKARIDPGCWSVVSLLHGGADHQRIDRFHHFLSCAAARNSTASDTRTIQ